MHNRENDVRGGAGASSSDDTYENEFRQKQELDWDTADEIVQAYNSGELQRKLPMLGAAIRQILKQERVSV